MDFTRQDGGAIGQAAARDEQQQGRGGGNSKAAKKLKNKQFKNAQAAGLAPPGGSAQSGQGHYGGSAHYHGNSSAEARHGSNSRADQERAQREGLVSYYGRTDGYHTDPYAAHSGYGHTAGAAGYGATAYSVSGGYATAYYGA